MHIIFFTNIISPYRVALFNELEIVRSNYDFTFEVFFMRKTESNRKWIVNLNDLHFKYVVGNGFYAHFVGLFWHFNPLLIIKMIRSGHEIILGASWNNLNVMFLVFLKRVGLIKNRLSVWSEANYLTLGSQKRNRIRDYLRKWFFSGINGSFIIPGKMAKISFQKWGIDIKNEVFLPNLVSTDYLKVNDADQKSNTLTKPIVLIVARLEERLKGILNFIKSIGDENIRQIEIRIIGEGSSVIEYKKYVSSHKLNENVFFLGNMNQVQVINQYRDADIFVLPSFSDPSPLTIVEAIWSGLPLLISERCGNHFETVENGVNGYTFNPFDPMDIKEKFDLMLSQKHRWSYFSQKSIDLARKNFKTKVVLSNFIQQMQHVII